MLRPTRLISSGLVYYVADAGQKPPKYRNSDQFFAFLGGGL